MKDKKSSQAPPFTPLILTRARAQEPPLPTNGTGRFKFANKALYEGEWQLFDGAKTRHGQGTFTQCGEVYEGSWVKVSFRKLAILIFVLL